MQGKELMFVAIYARVSTGPSGGQSIQDQLEQIRKYAANNNYTVVMEFVDASSIKAELEEIRGYSQDLGAVVSREYLDNQGSRQQFQQMMNDATEKSPGFEAIIVRNLSRPTRDLREFKDSLCRLEANGVRIVSIMEAGG